MVTIIDYKAYQREEDGTEFFALVVQGGVEAVKSQETGRTYLTVRKTQVSCTFDEETCKALKGTQIPGEVKKVETEPYEYVVPETSEIIMLSHSYRFVSEEEHLLESNLVEMEQVV